MKRGEALQWPTMILDRRYRKLNPTPEYQRNEVWSIKQKQLLIDTMIRNMPIPKLYFRVVDNDDDYDYEIIDGQQRINAIWEYRIGDFKLSKIYTPEYADLRYNELPLKAKDAIDYYQLEITIIQEATDEEIRDMFYRLQNGTSLVSAEKRNAIGGNIRDFIADLVNTHLVFETFQQRNTRFSYDHVTAQCMLLEINNNITNATAPQLERLYRENQDFNTNGAAAKKVKRVMNYLARTFREKTPEFRTRAHFISLYWLVSQTIDIYTMSGYEEILHDFFCEFETNRQLLDKENFFYLNFTEALKGSSDGREKIQRRHDMLMEEWLLFATDLELKDTQRNFTVEQRNALYRRDDKTCQICGEPVEIENFEADHIIPYARGGKTTIAHGQIAHSICNNKKGVRT